MKFANRSSDSKSASETGAPKRGAPGLVREALRSTAQPLSAEARAFVEPRLGHNFADVLVHTDERAAESARAIGARAYTVGNHVVFNSGRYAPQTPAGLRLLAHELTHVVQQQGGAGAEPKGFSSPAHEREAGRVADAVTSGTSAAPVLRSGPVLAMEPEPGGPQPAGDAGTPPPTALAAPGGKPKANVESIEVGKTSYVLYPTIVRFGGSSSWLANNPGNMDYTDNTRNWHCYEGVTLRWGKHNFAIFPDEETGLDAVERFLRKFQGERDIRLMMSLFAPAGDLKNDPKSYSAQVAAKMRVPETTLVKTMSDEQLVIFAEAIQEVEGWKIGTEVPRGDASLPEEVRRR